MYIMLSDIERHKILDSVLSKIGSYRCPICGSDQFTIVDGYVATCLQNNTKNITIGSSFLPSVVLVCTKCGFTSFHNAKILEIEATR